MNQSEQYRQSMKRNRTGETKRGRKKPKTVSKEAGVEKSKKTLDVLQSVCDALDKELTKTAKIGAEVVLDKDDEAVLPLGEFEQHVVQDDAELGMDREIKQEQVVLDPLDELEYNPTAPPPLFDVQECIQRLEDETKQPYFIGEFDYLRIRHALPGVQAMKEVLKDLTSKIEQVQREMNQVDFRSWGGPRNPCIAYQDMCNHLNALSATRKKFDVDGWLKTFYRMKVLVPSTMPYSRKQQQTRKQITTAGPLHV